MKQIEATILGQSYMLACPPDGETLLREAVAIVDREMSAIRDAGKVKARASTACWARTASCCEKLLCSRGIGRA